MSRLAQPGRWHGQRGLGVPLPPDPDLPPAYDMGTEACSLARLSLILFRHVLSARQNLGTARPSGSLHYKVKRETGLRAGAGEVGSAGTGARQGCGTPAGMGPPPGGV